MTYGTPDLGSVPRALRRVVMPAFRMLGEPLRGLMTTDDAASLVASRGFAIEDEIAIDLEEMTVRSDLHRPIAAVGHAETSRRSAGIQLDRIGGQQILAWDHGRRLLGFMASARSDGGR